MHWEDVFKYVDGKLYWLHNYRGKVKAGDTAGYRKSTGYWIVKYKQAKLHLHRIVWEMHKGTIPKGMVVDHIDRNPSNNLIDNLRLATITENNWNSGMHKDNRTQLKGVSFHPKSGKFRSRIMKNRKDICLGYFTTKEEAYAAYCAASKVFHSSFSCV
jgi:hypothetical protein